jgi:hypothetical protein
MIYTKELNEDTTHILVYKYTTPICVINVQNANKKPFYIYPHVWEAYWTEYVQVVLNKLAKNMGLDAKNLSAKPFDVLTDYEILTKGIENE